MNEPPGFFSNSLSNLSPSPSPCDLTEASLEELLIELWKIPGPPLSIHYNAITRFEIVGPYCPLPQRDHPYIHVIYPVDLDPLNPRYLTVLMAL